MDSNQVSSTPAVCPKCGRDDQVRKVSAVISSGRSTTVGGQLAPFPGQPAIPGYNVGSISSLISAQLAPPQRPAQPSGLNGAQLAGFIAIMAFILIGICATIGGIASAVSALSASNSVTTNVTNAGILFVILVATPLAVVALLIVGLIVFARYVSRTNKAKSAQFTPMFERWQKAYMRWEQLYYCQRDDGVFTPGSSDFVPTPQMQAYLFRQ